MGIIHLAPVGRSPGAVTTPLAHLKHVYEEQTAKGQQLEKSVLSPMLGYPVEAVVLFVSDDVRRGRKGATAYETVYNSYGARTPIRSYRASDEANVIDIIGDFADRELSDGKLVLYARTVRGDDFNDCFQAIAEAVLALGRPDDLGKTLWANLTGGTNVLNAALLEVTFLSGLISSLYYIFANEDERKFLQPLSTDYRRFLDNHWQDIPVIKTTFDERYRRLLLMLAESERESWDVDELLRHLQQTSPEWFGNETPDLFQKQWLRKMGRELELDVEASRVRITEAGYDAVARMEEELFHTLVQRGDSPLVDIQALRDKLEEYRI